MVWLILEEQSDPALGVRSNIIKFRLPCYQILRVFSQIKDRKHIEQNFHSVAGSMPQGWDLGYSRYIDAKEPIGSKLLSWALSAPGKEPIS